MNPIETLRKEHEDIKIELDELDFIMGSSGCPTSNFEIKDGGDINYPNLIHTFWKVGKLWDNHEKMEEELFKVMDREGFKIPIKSIFLEHKSLRKQVKKIESAINSGSDFEMRKVLCKEMKEFVDVLRKHAEDEEDVLSGVIIGDFSEEGMGEIKEIVGKYKG